METRPIKHIPRGEKRHRGEVPPDMKKCATGCYVWGTKLNVMIDILVLGASLKRHGNQAARVLCINDDTKKQRMSNLFRAFWSLVPVSHVELPRHLEKTEMKRLQGVYSKLQTLQVFDERPNKFKRLLLMDGDMLVRTNIDDLFATNTPAACMRGEADTCLYERRPSSSYFFGGTERSFTEGKQKMKGGINGGLLLLKPSVETYEEIYEALKNFRPNTTMAEQEFPSFHWGGHGEWWAMHKKNNFQLHQLYLTLPIPPPGQSRESGMKHMIENPEDIRIFHFSADMKPSEILIDRMPAVQGWLDLNEHLKLHTEYMMNTHGVRNTELEKYPEWIKKIQKLDEEAHREWFCAWKNTWLDLITHVWQEVFNRVIKVSNTPEIPDHISYRCRACGNIWLMTADEVDTNIIRDHVLFNCNDLATYMLMPMKHMTNLTTFFFIPCGNQVESKMVYLSAVYNYSRCRWDLKGDFQPPLNHEVQPQILLPSYTIPKHVLAITEDEGIDAAEALPDEKEYSIKAIKRRYERAMATAKNTPLYAWKTSSAVAKTWRSTLMTAAKSAAWLMEHEFPLLKDDFTTPQSASGSSSSSQPVPSSPINTGVQPQAPPSRPLPPQPPPPPTKAKARPSKKIEGTKHVPKQPAYPPPPPPPRS